MSRHFLAVATWMIAAIILAIGAGDVRQAVRDRRTTVAVQVLLAVAGLAAVLANDGADLW